MHQSWQEIENVPKDSTSASLFLWFFCVTCRGMFSASYSMIIQALFLASNDFGQLKIFIFSSCYNSTVSEMFTLSIGGDW